MSPDRKQARDALAFTAGIFVMLGVVACLCQVSLWLARWIRS